MKSFSGLSSVLCLLFMTAVNAQDIITLRNGEEISGKVLKVGPVEIEYRRADNPDGPVYTKPRSSVLMIRYKNGTKDIMVAEPSSPVLPGTPSQTGVLAASPPVQEKPHSSVRKPLTLLGVGYIDYIDEGFNLSILSGMFEAGRINPIFIGYLSMWGEEYSDPYEDIYSEILGGSAGITYGVSPTVYLYGTGGILWYTLYGTLIPNEEEISEVWPVVEFGVGVVLQPFAVSVGYNLPDFETEAAALNLMVSVAF